MTTRMLTAVLLLSATPIALLAGCNDRNLERGPDASADVGSAAGSGGTVADSGSGGQSPPADATTGDTSAGLDTGAREVGMLGPSSSWTGYIENHKFQSGSDVLKITFASDAAGLVVGKITLGSGTPPPPATDPEAEYPPGVDPRSATRGGYLAEGFSYSMNGGTLMTRRLRFTLALYEVWSGWCALQTPVDNTDRCVPNWGGMATADNMCFQTNPQTGQVVKVSCAKFFLCGFTGSVCTCAAGACAADTSSSDVSFDLAITGDQADGSVTGKLGDRNVHFTKDM